MPLNIDVDRLKGLAVSETGLIFDPSTGSIFTTNNTGAFLFTALKDGKDINEIKESIVNEYEVDDNTAELDILDFINQLTNCGVVKNV
ncbi:MAG: PqqD family protein [Thermodesulfovibrionales bacterium]|nr:PqqD family protein [Thermodesulfovibrionales bacterium]